MRGTTKHLVIALSLVVGACVDGVGPNEERADEIDEVDEVDKVGEVGSDESVEAPVSSYTDDVGPSWVLYPSAYNSNCSCTFCTKYCEVNGQVVKSGTCC